MVRNRGKSNKVRSHQTPFWFCAATIGRRRQLFLSLYTYIFHIPVSWCGPATPIYVSNSIGLWFYTGVFIITSCTEALDVASSNQPHQRYLRQHLKSAHCGLWIDLTSVL